MRTARVVVLESNPHTAFRSATGLELLGKFAFGMTTPYGARKRLRDSLTWLDRFRTDLRYSDREGGCVKINRQAIAVETFRSLGQAGREMTPTCF